MSIVKNYVNPFLRFTVSILVPIFDLTLDPVSTPPTSGITTNWKSGFKKVDLSDLSF
jgi:hypothetical protein